MLPSTEDRPKTWKEIVVEEYKQGASDIEVCDALGMSKAEFDRMYRDNQDFRELVDIGRLAQTAWWYRTGRKNLNNKSFNNTVWMFNMKNRFGWAEKSESTNVSAPEDQKTLDELQQDVVAKMPGILKRLGVQMKDAQILDLKKTRDE